MKTNITNTAKILGLTLVLSAILFSGCTKDGAQGPQGAAGTNGSNGTNGTDGNANVTDYAAIIPSGNWILSGNTYYCDLTIPAITSDIVSSGAVHIYMESTSTPDVWLNMPWTEYPSGSYFSVYNFNHSFASVRISKSNSDLSTPSNPGTRSFKIIVISSGALIAHPNTDYRNYEQVRTDLDLKKESKQAFIKTR